MHLIVLQHIDWSALSRMLGAHRWSPPMYRSASPPRKATESQRYTSFLRTCHRPWKSALTLCQNGRVCACAPRLCRGVSSCHKFCADALIWIIHPVHGAHYVSWSTHRTDWWKCGVSGNSRRGHVSCVNSAHTLQTELRGSKQLFKNNELKLTLHSTALG